MKFLDDKISHARKILEYYVKKFYGIEVKEISFFKRWIVRLIRITFLSSKGFFNNRCLQFSSSLSFVTLFSLVPVLAVIFSITKVLGLHNFLEKVVLERVTDGVGEILSQFLVYVKNTNFSTLGILGVIFTLFTGVKIISMVESIFNEIWRVKEGRPWWKKISEYISLIIITPIFLSGAITLTIVLQHTTFFQRFFSFLKTKEFLLFSYPYISAWLVFSFLYFFLPNTKVKLKSAVISGIVSGTLWQLTQWFYFHFQIGFTRYNAIYGSFAQIFLFLIWMQLSWAILLFGVEISYVLQNIESLEKKLKTS